MDLTIADVASLATALTLLVALGFGLRQAMDMERKRRQDATIEVLKPFQTLEWVETIRYVQGMARPEPHQVAKGVRDVDARAIQIVEQMEVLGILVADRVIEIDIIEKMLGSFVTGAWHKLQPQIEYARQSTEDPKIAEYFQWLADRIAEREAQGPTLPAYVALRRWRA